MNNYEKALRLLDEGIAKEHYTYQRYRVYQP